MKSAYRAYICGIQLKTYPVSGYSQSRLFELHVNETIMLFLITKKFHLWFIVRAIDFLQILDNTGT